jgi:phosphoenolpyruvate carboxylase
VGAAWRSLGAAEKAQLKRAFDEEPVFGSYVRALGFTLGKVELPVWRMYLESSGLPDELIADFYSRFQAELKGALEMLREVTGQRDPLWFRPWLGASIRLRSPMIHPLNLLQILAIEDRDFRLLRRTVTGIASGMMTTG